MAITETYKQTIVYQILKIPGIGPVKFWRALEKTNDLEELYENFKRSFKCESIEKGLSEIENYTKLGINCICFWQNNYPQQLKRLHDAPPIIWIKGHVDFLQQPQVAIVGGRNASFHGIRFAQNLSKELSDYGYTVVSGLARGIDKAAHLGAYDNKTVAVLAGGVDKLYPKENLQLYDNLCEKHLVISEMPPGIEPTAELFPRRNRIIAALSNGICVIEAAMKSGSLLTAKYGLDIGLPIFACPGHPYDPRTKGSNQLIKDGAFLLDTPSEVIEQIPIKPSPAQLQAKPYISPSTSYKPTNELSQEIVNFLSHTPVKIDDLLRHLNQYPTETVLMILSELELKNVIQRSGTELLELGK